MLRECPLYGASAPMSASGIKRQDAFKASSVQSAFKKARDD